MTQRFKFKPVYGYGWRSGAVTIEVPAPFVVEGVETGSSIIEGRIMNAHVFSNHSVSLSQRSSAESVKQFNVIIYPEQQGEEITGFAELIVQWKSV